MSDEKTNWNKWPGPPGCTCDFKKRSKDRCTKSGWIRCKGAMDLHNAQLRYRDKVGEKGGPDDLVVTRAARETKA